MSQPHPLGRVAGEGVLYRLRLTSVFALHLQQCFVGFELLSMTALAMGLFARRPPLVVPRSRCQPPPLKPF